MSITIRAALEEDFLAMRKMDLAANVVHPFYVIPWKAVGPEACEDFILDRYKHLYHSYNPPCTFLVATAGDEIIGYLFYREPLGEKEPDEWNPSFPNGTNLKFFEKVLGQVKVAKNQHELRGCWGTYFLGISFFECLVYRRY